MPEQPRGSNVAISWFAPCVVQDWVIDLRQRERDELRCVLLTANGKYHVLLAAVHVRHRRAGRSRLEMCRPQEFARFLVERAELIPAETGRRADGDLIADGRKEQRPGCDHSGTRRVAERPQFEMRDCGMIPRAIAVRCGPHLFTAIQIEGRNTPV